MFPPQETLAGAVHGDRAGFFGLHDDPRYRGACELLIGGGPAVLVCECCSFGAPRDLVLKEAAALFGASDADNAVANGVAPKRPLPGADLFAVHHRNHNHEDFSFHNLGVVCEPCHHAHHLLVGGMDPAGEPILLGGLSQADICAMWSSLVVRTGIAGVFGRNARDALDKLGVLGRINVGSILGPSNGRITGHEARAIKASVTQVNPDAAKALAGHVDQMQESDAPFNGMAAASAGAVAHYVKNCDDEKYKQFQRALPDLRFLPSEAGLVAFVDFSRRLYMASRPDTGTIAA